MTRLCESCATDEPSAPVVRQPEAADQAQADPARGPVPLDAGDQEDVALRVERPVAVDPADASRACAG